MTSCRFHELAPHIIMQACLHTCVNPKHGCDCKAARRRGGRCERCTLQYSEHGHAPLTSSPYIIPSAVLSVNSSFNVSSKTQRAYAGSLCSLQTTGSALRSAGSMATNAMTAQARALPLHSTSSSIGSPNLLRRPPACRSIASTRQRAPCLLRRGQIPAPHSVAAGAAAAAADVESATAVEPASAAPGPAPRPARDPLPAAVPWQEAGQGLVLFSGGSASFRVWAPHAEAITLQVVPAARFAPTPSPPLPTAEDGSPSGQRTVPPPLDQPEAAQAAAQEHALTRHGDDWGASLVRVAGWVGLCECWYVCACEERTAWLALCWTCQPHLCLAANATHVSGSAKAVRLQLASCLQPAFHAPALPQAPNLKPPHVPPFSPLFVISSPSSCTSPPVPCPMAMRTAWY